MSEENPSIKEIVTKYLEVNGFDGLYLEDLGDGCGCRLPDLFPCSEGFSPEECIAGYAHPCDGDPEICDGKCAFHMKAEKAK